MFTYGSPLYLITVVSAPLLAALLWFLFKKKSKKVQKLLIASIMLANIIQHLFKSVIYPQYAQGFTAISTAYNMCALLILISPIALFANWRPLKNFLFFTGTVAGIAAIIVPAWYIGSPVKTLGWDYFRYYICHLGLFLSSVLPLAFQHHTPRRKEFWQVGLLFLLALCVILLNDVTIMAMGLYPNADINHFYDCMVEINPFGMMGPPTMASWVENLVQPFSPSIFLGNNPAGLYVPILWYAIPLYLGISLLCLVTFFIFDRKKK